MQRIVRSARAALTVLPRTAFGVRRAVPVATEWY
jgi:hypothetical protein